MDYDSTLETMKHKDRVAYFLLFCAHELIKRAMVHDNSKLMEPEKAIFDEFTPKLKASTYGSEEYKGFLKDMGAGLKAHYEANRHHPEHFPEGIYGMHLIDVLEMVCDWRAATERHANGDIYSSIEKNTERFGLSPQLAEILTNTADWMNPSKGA